MRLVSAFVLSCALVAPASTARAQGIIVDHTSLPLFAQIPEQYLVAASNLSMMFVDRSVGANIDDGLACLQTESDELARSACKRTTHVVPQFSSPASEVNWFRPGGYDRRKWLYYSWPGSSPDGPISRREITCGVTPDYWFRELECFLQFVTSNPATYTVYSYEFSYLDVEEQSDIASPATGFFARRSNRVDLDDVEALERSHPWIALVHQTSSLARAIGSRVSADFNNQLREYVRANNKIMLDVADIESHDPFGQACYDNRDGVRYAPGNGFENHPDDGLNLPALCQHYTRELEGGHLGNPDVGKIRLAKAFWILMARIAGWNPTPRPSAPTRLFR